MASLFDAPVLGGLFGDQLSSPERQALNMGLLGLSAGLLDGGGFGQGFRNFQSLYQSGLQSGQAAEEKEREKRLAEAYQSLFDNTGTQAGGGNLPPLGTERVGATDAGRPIIQNPDGSVSTERTVTIEVDGQFLNIPTMFDGRQVSPDEAADIMQRNGWVDPETGRRITPYSTLEEAEAAAQARSASLGQRYGGGPLSPSPGGGLFNLTPQQRSLLSVLPPEQGLPLLLEQTFKPPEPPKTRTVRIGEEQVTQQFNPATGGWDEVARGPAFRTTPETVVNLPTQEEAEDKAFGQDLVAQYTTVREDAAAAGNVLTQLEIARSIPVQTGALEPFKAKVSALAQSIGVDPTTLGLQDATNPQAFVGIMQNLVLAKMQAQKGPQTENDAKRIEATVASLGNTPEAADFLLKAAIATERRKVQQANFYDQWRAEKGTFEGARAAWEQYKRETPLMGTNPNSGLPVFFDEFQTLMRQANPTATDEQILALWRQKYGRTR